jgi:hypothetical protein
MIKVFSFSFLETNNIAITSIDPLPYIVPSLLGINPSNVPIKNIPASRHLINQWIKFLIGLVNLVANLKNLV